MPGPIPPGVSSIPRGMSTKLGTSGRGPTGRYSIKMDQGRRLKRPGNSAKRGRGFRSAARLRDRGVVARRMRQSR